MLNGTSNKKSIQGYTFDEAKYWARVDKSGDCWNWTGAKNTTGYGLFHVRNSIEQYDKTGRTWSQLLAHRIAFYLANGDIRNDLYIIHDCDNRSCCNPAHLRQGTQLDNVLDMISKGRQGFGRR